MNRTRIQLTKQREHLIARAAAQRLSLAQTLEPLRVPIHRIDQGLAVLRYIARHPAWIIGGGFVIATLRPARVGAWLGRGWMIWKILRKLRNNKQ